MTITPAVFLQLPLPNVRAVVFHKPDEIPTDLICCDVEVAGHVWSFNEEAAGRAQGATAGFNGIVRLLWKAGRYEDVSPL